MSKAGGEVLPLAAESWVYGAAQTTEGINVAGVTVMLGEHSSTTNPSGSWGFYARLAPNSRYTLSVRVPDQYTIIDVGGAGIVRWTQAEIEFRAGAEVGSLYGPIQVIMSSKATPTPDPNLLPPSVWPWPIIEPTDAEKAEIAKCARVNLRVEGEPWEEVITSPLWQVGHKYQLGLQWGPQFIVGPYRCLTFSQGIVVMPIGDDVHFGVVSPFGGWIHDDEN